MSNVIINYFIVYLPTFILLLFNYRTGRQMYLTHHQENRVVHFLLAMLKIGKAISKQEIPAIIKDVLDKAEEEGLVDRECRKFKDNLQSNGWIY